MIPTVAHRGEFAAIKNSRVISHLRFEFSRDKIKEWLDSVNEGCFVLAWLKPGGKMKIPKYSLPLER
jgi:hypothetical protein